MSNNTTATQYGDWLASASLTVEPLVKLLVNPSMQLGSMRQIIGRFIGLLNNINIVNWIPFGDIFMNI
ncbi:hypothetical protein AKJ17_04980 [Vibrio nereis]|uniref:Uncharacterized protein n=1 Tax=Vibrio nereis TaxID=693 RepID=A0A0M0HQC8_VIBNE|nr:hypothetical protein AKJ17_04980 [Vibrio nereis]